MLIVNRVHHGTIVTLALKCLLIMHISKIFYFFSEIRYHWDIELNSHNYKCRFGSNLDTNQLFPNLDFWFETYEFNLKFKSLLEISSTLGWSSYIITFTTYLKSTEHVYPCWSIYEHVSIWFYGLHWFVQSKYECITTTLTFRILLPARKELNVKLTRIAKNLQAFKHGQLLVQLSICVLKDWRQSIIYWKNSFQSIGLIQYIQKKTSLVTKRKSKSKFLCRNTTRRSNLSH